MPKNITQYDLLISCPSDIKDEISIIEEIVENFNIAYSSVLGLSIQTRHWSNSAYPESGGKPQPLLNRQFIEECDAAVAVFWNRFGSPTDKYGSGTEEEIELMIESGKQVFLYFSDVPIPPSEMDKEQRERVEIFKEKYKGKGIFWTYSTFDEFRQKFRAHLDLHFLTLLKVTEIDNAKKPHINLSFISPETGDPITNKYEYHWPTGLLHRRELSEDDLDDKIADMVSIDDIRAYNLELPTAEVIEEFNAQQKLFENAKNNRHDVQIKINNSGRAVGRNISIDIFFPEEILVYKDYNADDISAPRNTPEIPSNPVLDAYDKLDERSMRKLYRPFMKEYDLIEQHVNMMSGLSLAASAIETQLSANNFGSRKLSAMISAQGYNYDVEDHSQISMHIANLVHSRDYISDPMSLIITMCGEFVISYEIMCEEFEEPLKGKYEITVVRD